MATNLRTSLRTEINRVERDISRKTTELTSLSNQLKKLQGAQALLDSGRAPAPRRARPPRRRTRATTGKPRVIDWNSLLKSLPASFSLDSLAKNGTVRGKSRAYLRQMVSKWVKGRKVKRTGRGRYQKQ